MGKWKFVFHYYVVIAYYVCWLLKKKVKLFDVHFMSLKKDMTVIQINN